MGAGERRLAEEYITRCVAIAEILDLPNSSAQAFYASAAFHQFADDRDVTLAFARRAVPISEKFGLFPWRAGSLILTAWATAIGDGV
jgi:hypothetical protein